MTCADCGNELRGDPCVSYEGAKVVCRRHFQERVVAITKPPLPPGVDFAKLPDDFLKLPDCSRLMWAI